MTEKEMRKLDFWIDRNFTGWAQNYIDDGRKVTEGDIPYYTVSSSHFVHVKYELKHRGWKWTCTYNPSTKEYGFSIEKDGQEWGIVAESEELAGCLAVKAALESQR